MKYIDVKATRDNDNVSYEAIYWGVCKPEDAVAIFLEECPEYSTPEWTIRVKVYDD